MKDFINLDKVIVEEKALKAIPEYMCTKNHIIPIKLNDKKIYLVSSSNLSENILNEIKFLTKCDVEVLKGEESQIKSYVKTYYSKYEAQIALHKFKKENLKDEKSYKKIYDDEPVIKLTNSIIDEAISKKASDIHIEPFEKYCIIRFRIDGILRKFMKINKELYSLLNVRVKIISNMDITEKRLPQDGKIKATFRKNHNFRVSTLPTVYGEKIVIRILYKDSKIKSLDKLGFEKKDIEIFKNMIMSSNGVILSCGPTGSGKSTTLYSILNNINSKEKNIVTIEEPVEYTIDGINQINVNTKINLGFLQGLKSVLRQDPDVIMVGEIRDEETAKVCLRASITGHLVLSTIHTNGALEAIIRLLDMGIPYYMLCDGLKGIIYQRLVRKICPKCKEKYLASDIEKSYLNSNEDFYLYKGRGCTECNHTGFKGRTVLYEYMNIGNKEREYIRKLDKIKENKRKLIKNTFKDKAIESVKKGVTTFEEIKKIIF